MTGLDTVEMLAFSLKLIGKKTRKNVLISAGKPADKDKMFPAIEKLAKLNVSIYATPGTYALTCFAPDVKDGKTHAEHGMTSEFVVK